MQNLNGYGLAFFHCIPFCFREQADLGALSQKNMPLGCAKVGPHPDFIAPLLPNPPCALEGVVNGGVLTKAGCRFSAAKRAGFQGAAVVDP
jgi:hypothetical protein